MSKFGAVCLIIRSDLNVIHPHIFLHILITLSGQMITSCICPQKRSLLLFPRDTFLLQESLDAMVIGVYDYSEWGNARFTMIGSLYFVLAADKIWSSVVFSGCIWPFSDRRSWERNEHQLVQSTGSRMEQKQGHPVTI